MNSSTKPNNTTFQAIEPHMSQMSDVYVNAENSNETRAKSGWLAITAYSKKAYRDPSGESVEETIRDLLSDLQHTCQHLGFDFTDIAEKASQTFHEEIEDANS